MTFLNSSNFLHCQISNSFLSWLMKLWNVAVLMTIYGKSSVYQRSRELLRCLFIVEYSSIKWNCSLTWSQLHLHMEYCHNPADTRCWINAGLTLVQRRRRWTNVKPTLIQHLVSAGNSVFQWANYAWMFWNGIQLFWHMVRERTDNVQI